MIFIEYLSSFAIAVKMSVELVVRKSFEPNSRLDNRFGLGNHWIRVLQTKTIRETLGKTYLFPSAMHRKRVE